MANGAQIGQAGQGHITPLRRGGQPGNALPDDAGYTDYADDDQLDIFAQVWRRGSRGGAYEVGDLSDDGPEGDALEDSNSGLTAEMIRRRARIRRQLREFLRAVPRQESDASLTFTRLDGVQRRVSRRELTAAIDRMRPRMRQIVRLAVEERWPRQRVCEYLGHISLKTVERDQREAIDQLAEL